MDKQRKPSIKEWAIEDRPREKLMQVGASQLSKAELLGILIGSGNAEENAVELMRRVMADCDDSLERLGRLSPEELIHTYKGIGEAKAITIIAACELSRRRISEGFEERPTIYGSRDIYNYYRNALQENHLEECHLLLMNQAHRVLGSRLLSRGGMTSAVADVREALRIALVNHATAIAFCHNHPSGSYRPSGDDDNLTHKLYDAARMMDITLLDHVIISTDGFYSYADHERLQR